MITYAQYCRIGKFFEHMKAIHGPDFVNATLNRHKILRQALLDYEKCFIIDTEGELS